MIIAYLINILLFASFIFAAPIPDSGSVSISPSELIGIGLAVVGGFKAKNIYDERRAKRKAEKAELVTKLDDANGQLRTLHNELAEANERHTNLEKEIGKLKTVMYEELPPHLKGLGSRLSSLESLVNEAKTPRA